MRTTRTSRVLTSTLTAALGVTLLAVAPAAANGSTILRDKLIGTLPLTDPVHPSPVIAGVNPGGAPWVLDKNSRVRVREDGRIALVVRGLVIPGRTPGNPVALMAASLVCGDMVVDSTGSFPVDEDGNGRIRDEIDVPVDCDDPIVLVRNAINPAALGAYFAVTMDD